MTMSGFFAKRPWIWVWVAFIVLIAAWVGLFLLSGTVPVTSLSPEEEKAILLRKEELKP